MQYTIFGEPFRKELEIAIAKILVEFRNNGLLHFVAFFQVASLFFIEVDN